MDRKLVAQGVFWSFVNVCGGQILSILVFVVLTRLVVPAEFGVVSIASTFVAITNMVQLHGLSAALVQRGRVDQVTMSSAFWGSLGFGAALAAALFASSDLIAVVFHEARVAPIMRALSLECLINGMTVIPQAIFRRHLQIQTLAVRSLAGLVLGGGAGIVLAWKGYGMWALVGFQLGNAVATFIVVWIRTDWRPSLRFSSEELAGLTGYAFYNALSSMILAVDYRIDTLIIGYFFDVEKLGYYTFALRILHSLGSITLNPFNDMALPVLSRVAHDKKLFNRGYRRIILSQTFLWLPGCLGIGLVADQILPLVCGPQWIPAVPVMWVVCPAAFTVALSSPTVEALGSLGHPKTMSAIAVIQLVVMSVIYSGGAKIGFLWACAGFSLVPLVMAPIHIGAVRRYSGLNLGDLAMGYFAFVLAGLGMTAVVMILRMWGANLEIEIAAGALTYLALVQLTSPGFFRSMVPLVRDALPKFPRTQSHEDQYAAHEGDDRDPDVAQTPQAVPPPS
jgi:O-antigen/teichoic acid export membrane protein